TAVHPKPERPTPERPTPERPTPERPTPERPTPERPTPERLKPGRSMSAQLSLVRPAPTRPPQPAEGAAWAGAAHEDEDRADENRETRADENRETWPLTREKPRKGRQAMLPPWPGRLPRPQPAVVLPRPLGAVVLDAAGSPVGVSARLEL